MSSSSQANDKLEEQTRYELSALVELEGAQTGGLPLGSEDLAPQFHAPYELFEACLDLVVTYDSTVLELGAGSGRYTALIAARSSRVVALDISLNALRVGRLRTAARCHSVCADIERLPVRSDSVDVVVSAGSLSYGSADVVLPEIRRVLRKGGSLVVVDSLNHNPIYRLNRWRHYRRGQRSLMTIRNMPTDSTVESLAQGFERACVRRSGALLFMHPAISRALGPPRALKVSKYLDQRFGGGRNGFKFVLLATGFARETANG